jgi:hypothetical protein
MQHSGMGLRQNTPWRLKPRVNDEHAAAARQGEIDDRPPIEAGEIRSMYEAAVK